MSKKVLFIATVSSHWNFHIPYMKMLKEMGYEVHAISNGSFKNEYCEKHFDIKIQRTPFSFKNVEAYNKVKDIILQNQYKIITCHTPIGGVIGRLSAKSRRSNGTKVLYTAHGFHFYKGAPLINWLIYYPVEKICSYFTDALITINQEDYQLALKKMKAKNIYYIPGIGVDTKALSDMKVDKSSVRKELGISDDAIMLLSVGELNKNKNHEIIIRALAKLDDKNVHYFIAGKGALQEYLTSLSSSLKIGNQVHLLGFRNDIPQLCGAADIFCFPSQREGLGLAALEAMCMGLPIITSNVHGIVDYSVDQVTGFTCTPDDIDSFARAIDTLSKNKKKRNSIGTYNRHSVDKFDIRNALDAMRSIYKDVTTSTNSR